MALSDEKGKRAFSDQDIDKLGKKSQIVLDRVMAAAMTLNLYINEGVESAVRT